MKLSENGWTKEQLEEALRKERQIIADLDLEAAKHEEYINALSRELARMKGKRK